MSRIKLLASKGSDENKPDAPESNVQLADGAQRRLLGRRCIFSWKSVLHVEFYRFTKSAKRPWSIDFIFPGKFPADGIFSRIEKHPCGDGARNLARGLLSSLVMNRQ